MRRLRVLHGFGSEEGTSLESLPDVDQRSMDDASTSSTDDRSDLTGTDRDLSFSYCHDEAASSSDGSAPLGWPLGSCRDRPSSAASSKMGSGHNTFMWEEKREKRETELSGWKLSPPKLRQFKLSILEKLLVFNIFTFSRQRWR